MCRWFAYISDTEPCLLEDVLITPKHGLGRQVNDHYLPGLVAHDNSASPSEREAAARNIVLNVDGTGILWYTNAQSEFGAVDSGSRPTMYKTVATPLHDSNFRSLCDNIHTLTLFAHIRATSGTAVATVNNHPFIFGRHSFMHNGGISDFTAIRRDFVQMLDAATFAHVLGSTDTEHLAALYMTKLTGGRGIDAWEEEYSVTDMALAMHNAVGELIDLQKRVLGSKARPNSLNLAATDGKKMVCYRFRNHATQQPGSLYYSQTAGVTLNRKFPGHPNKGVENTMAVKSAEEHGNHVIVASEPSTYDEKEWTLIGKNTALLAYEGGHVELVTIPYKEEWNAEDPDAITTATK